MASHHHHHAATNASRLAWTLALAAAYMVAEIVGGLLSNSLALLADAGHMFSDVAALGLSLFAIWIARRPATARSTYGFHRAEILAALANGATLVAVAVFIFIEAYHRIRQPPEVEGALMMGVAVGGLAVNLIGLWILGGGRHHNLNVRGAWLHVLSDALGSLGTIVAGVLVWAFGMNWADPLVSALIGILIIYSSWRLLAEAVAVLMESAPHGIDVDEVRSEIGRVPGVLGVHDLHIWTITSGLDALSAHVVAGQEPPPAVLLRSLSAMLAERFGIHHVTIQIEPEDFDEPGGPAHCPMH
ncbi:MAG: cation diffusion facilitator family transporter [Pirellulales bacterium]